MPRNHLARLTPDGRVDLTFDPGTGATGNMTGMGVDGSIRCVTIQTSGKIVVGGVFTHLGGNAYGGLGRFNPNGSVDDTFALTGGADGPLNAVALANGMSVVNVNRVAEGTELEDRPQQF